MTNFDEVFPSRGKPHSKHYTFSASKRNFMKTFLKLRLLFVYERFASKGKTENFLTLTSEIKILKGNAFIEGQRFCDV